MTDDDVIDFGKKKNLFGLFNNFADTIKATKKKWDESEYFGHFDAWLGMLIS